MIILYIENYSKEFVVYAYIYVSTYKCIDTYLQVFVCVGGAYTR